MYRFTAKARLEKEWSGFSDVLRYRRFLGEYWSLMGRWVIVAACLVYGFSLLAVIGTDPRPFPIVDRFPQVAIPKDTEQLIGMSLNVYHAEPFTLYLKALDQIAETGFNSVQVVTPMFQRDGSASQIELLRGPGRGPSRQQLVTILRRAQSLGLRTCFMPQVNFTEPRGNEWRGKIQPDQWSAWWSSYEVAIEYFLGIAIDVGTDLFSVGCELLSTQKPEHLSRWQALIAKSRKSFNGHLIYSTNWDAYDKVGFWRSLDAIGISGYWDLTTHAADRDNPTDRDLQARWHQIIDQVLAFAESQRRPVLLSELGYPCLPWALKDPWNYVPVGNMTADEKIQWRGLKSFLDAWRELIVPPQTEPTIQNRDRRILGVLFYEWDVYHRGDDQDTGYGIRGKSSHQLLKSWIGIPEESGS